MMKKYARIENGIVVEIVEPATWPDGSEIAVEDRFAPDFVASMVDISTFDPAPQVNWLYDGKVFSVPAHMTVEAKRATAWNGIKAERDRRKAGGILVSGKWFHTDPDSRIQQIGLAMMGANLPANLQWKTLDGSFVTMTPALAQGIFTGVVASDQVIFGAAEKHRVAMEASADPASYDYSDGWPKIYE